MRELRRRGFPEAEARRRAEMALALTLTAPGTAMIYAGQEFGEDTPKVVGANPLNWRRTEGWWGRGARDLRGAAQALLQLRANHPALRTGDVTVLRDGLPADVAVYTRSAGQAGVVVAANFGRRSQRVAVPLPHGGTWRNVISQEEFRPGRDGKASLLLAPGQAFVLSHDGDAPSENQEMSELATPPLATAL